MRTTMVLLLVGVLCGTSCTGGLPDRPETAALPSASSVQTTSDAGALSPVSVPASPAADAGAPAEPAPFNPPPVAAGYQRFVPSPLDVPAGSSEDWAQWVGGPLDQDYDVIDITGAQSVGGHHALVYATADANPPGFTRVWQDADQLTTRLMGGIGGEGGASAHLPPGVVFRVQKGSYIVLQTHFLNGGSRATVGHTVVDVKLAPVDRSRRVASIMSNTTLTVKVQPAVQTAIDVNCMVRDELHFIQIANHMHDYGRTAFTEFIDPSGQAHEIKSDSGWLGEWALNPNFSHFAVETPLVIPAGSKLHTRCTYTNETTKAITFPTEMCVFFGFILSESDVYCTDEKWTVASHPSADDMNAAGSLDAGAGNSDAGVGAEAGGPAGCLASNDQTIMNAAAFDQQSTDCSLPCAFDADVASCTARCFEKTVGLSASCARCNGTNVACGAKKCLTECVADSASDGCRACVLTNCDPAFHVCTGT